MYFSKPTSTFGYYRGSPNAFGGSGSGQGPAMAGNGIFPQGQGPVDNSTSQWNPTILYMFALIILEMVIFGFLARQV